jgi:hypothetical protein
MHPERRPNPDRSADPLADWLRALPPPPVPAELEARLLTSIPACRPAPRRRWAVWLGAAGVLAAACLLALLWMRDAGPGTRDETAPPNLAVSRPSKESAGVATWLASRRVPDEAATPSFTWPLGETSAIRLATAIPPNLLD